MAGLVLTVAVLGIEIGSLLLLPSMLAAAIGAAWAA